MRDLKQYATNPLKFKLLPIKEYIKEYSGLEFYVFLAYLEYYSFRKNDSFSKILRAVEGEEIYTCLSLNPYDTIHMDDAFEQAEYFKNLIYASLLEEYDYSNFIEYIEDSDFDENNNKESVIKKISDFLNENGVDKLYQQDIIKFFEDAPECGITYFISILESDELKKYFNDAELKESFEDSISGYFNSENKYLMYSWVCDDCGEVCEHVSPLNLLRTINIYINKYGDATRRRQENNDIVRELIKAQHISNKIEGISNYIDKFIRSVLLTFSTETEVMF